MNVSLIITTYNWPEALEVVIKSALLQTVLPKEIIIADDGSGNVTKELIERLRKNSGIPIIHSWQVDDGFRASMSRNKAIAKVKSEYVITIDGDMVLDKKFVEEHLKFAKKGFFVQGSRVLLDENLSATVLKDKKVDFNIFDNGVKNKLNSFHSDLLAGIYNSNSRSNNKMKGIKTCNFAFYKKDVIDVNGFNEDFIGWGREDSELVVRLFNNGIQRQDIKFNAIAYHIYHHENDRKNLDTNDKILDAAINEKLTWCSNGIDKYY